MVECLSFCTRIEAVLPDSPCAVTDSGPTHRRSQVAFDDDAGCPRAFSSPGTESSFPFEPSQRSVCFAVEDQPAAPLTQMLQQFLRIGAADPFQNLDRADRPPGFRRRNWIFAVADPPEQPLRLGGLPLKNRSAPERCSAE